MYNLIIDKLRFLSFFYFTACDAISYINIEAPFMLILALFSLSNYAENPKLTNTTNYKFRY